MSYMTHYQLSYEKNYCQGEDDVKLHRLQLSEPFFDRHCKVFNLFFPATKKKLNTSTSCSNRYSMAFLMLKRREINLWTN